MSALTANTIADLPRYQARIRPHALAMTCHERRTTYGQLDLRASQVANGLLQAGAQPGARVAYLGKNSEVHFEILLGAAKARCTMVPLNWRLAAPEVEFIIKDCQPDLIVIEPDFASQMGSLGIKPWTLIVDGPPGLEYRRWRDRQSGSDPALPTDAEDCIVIMYTSGTTGLPKGVELSDRNLMSHLSFLESGAFGPWSEEDIQLICLPLFHIGGTDSGLWSLYTGAMSLLLTDANTASIIDAFARYRVSIAGFVPTIMRAVLADPGVGKLDFSCLKLISYGGSPISPELMVQARETFGCRFQQLFGMTETTGGVSILSDEDHRSDDTGRRLRSCGRALPRAEIRIVDAEGREQSTGVAGEIAVRGPTVTKGYWHRPEETRGALRDGWYYTGDVGTLDADGYLFIHDRIKDMIVSGGENVYPTEVENAISQSEVVRESAVIGVPDARWGEAVKAFVVLRPGHSVSEADLLAFLRTCIAGYKCPKSIEFVASLPRNAAGKILRRELRSRYWDVGKSQVN
jgi:acyl-CoA synthetase (AMP-forming)/AMP-acid ligase II